MTTLYFERKNIFGNTLYYPDCDATRTLAKISNRKTFDARQVRLLNETYCFKVEAYASGTKIVFLSGE